MRTRRQTRVDRMALLEVHIGSDHSLTFVSIGEAEGKVKCDKISHLNLFWLATMNQWRKRFVLALRNSWYVCYTNHTASNCKAARAPLPRRIVFQWLKVKGHPQLIRQPASVPGTEISLFANPSLQC
jgi:hypothetical protein